MTGRDFWESLGRSVSYTLVLVNAVLFLLVVAVAGAEALFAPPLDTLAAMGGLLLRRLPQGGYPLLITYGYLHFGLIHFGFNMLVLSRVGPMLEDEIGGPRYFTLYTTALIGGGLLRYVVSGPINMVVVGASGGLFGLIGFGMAYTHALGGHTAHELRNFFLRWALYGFLFGLIVRADNWAHLGGFAVGAGLGLLLEKERHYRVRWTPVWTGLAWACAAATVAAFVWVMLQYAALQ